MARPRRLDIPTALDLLRATWELALARLKLVKFDPRRALANGKQSPVAEEIDRVAFAIRAMGARVPWRSDCLVQALAAQHWLAGRGIGSTIRVGVRASEAPIDAHAWLRVGDRIVIGGDVADYAEFPLHEHR